VWFGVKVHYGDPFWDVTLYYFKNVSHLKLLKESHNIFVYYVIIYPKQIFKNKLFYFIYKMRDWNIFVKISVVYMCTQKQKSPLKKN